MIVRANTFSEAMFGRELYPGEFEWWNRLFKGVTALSLAMGCKTQPAWLSLGLVAVFVGTVVKPADPLAEIACFALLSALALRQIVKDTYAELFRYVPQPAPKALQRTPAKAGPRTPAAATPRSAQPGASAPVQARVVAPEYEPIQGISERQAAKPIKSSPAPPPSVKATADSPVSRDDAVQAARRTAQEKLEARRKARIDELRGED